MPGILYQEGGARTDRHEKDQRNEPLQQSLVALGVKTGDPAHDRDEGDEQKVCEDEICLYGSRLRMSPQREQQKSGEQKNTHSKGIGAVSWVWQREIPGPQAPDPIQKQGKRGKPGENTMGADLPESKKKTNRGKDRCDPGDH